MSRSCLLVLSIALAAARLAAAPAGSPPIPVPDHLGVFIVAEDGSLTEIPPHLDFDRDTGRFGGGSRLFDMPMSALAASGAPVLGPSTPLVIYDPNWPMRAYSFLLIVASGGPDPRADARRFLVPRLRPSREVEGLWEVTWREPLEPGVLTISPVPLDVLEFVPMPFYPVLVTATGGSDESLSRAVAEEQRRVPLEEALGQLRALSVALESYMVDWNTYPGALPALTTPIAYLTRIPRDPFVAPAWQPWAYRRFEAGDPLSETYGAYVISSWGPDGDRDFSPEQPPASPWEVLFDPTNGSTSNGDLIQSPRLGAPW
jgi:hypothetical protein